MKQIESLIRKEKRNVNKIIKNPNSNSEIDVAIASCYDQIEVLKNKIRLLEAQKEKEASSETRNRKDTPHK